MEVSHESSGCHPASAPIEMRNLAAYILAFDNTGGLTTGLTLANVSGQAAVVPFLIRDDSGKLLQSTTINLPAHGHTSFLLPGEYKVTNGKRERWSSIRLRAVKSVLWACAPTTTARQPPYLCWAEFIESRNISACRSSGLCRWPEPGLPGRMASAGTHNLPEVDCRQSPRQIPTCTVRSRWARGL